jgi:hypothetical protein
MEFSSITITQLDVPVLQIVLLLVLSTGALLLRRAKLALMINYLFTLYWGYVLNSEVFVFAEKLDTFTLVYFGFGIGIVLLAAIGFLAPEDQYGS